MLQAAFGLAGLAAARAFAAPGALPRADAFAESVGVNVHLSSEPYRSRFGEVGRLLGEAGIRHLRDEMLAFDDIDRWRQLHAAHGIRAHLLVSPAHNRVADVLAFIEALGVERLSGLEGQNEGDSDWFRAQPAARPNWDRAVVDYQRAIYAAVRASYTADRLPILSPTVLDYLPQDMALLADAAPFSDIVAIHSYVQHGQEPETTDAYAAIGWYLARMRDTFKPGAPAMSTETGYNTLVRPGGGMSEAAAGLYLPRLLLTNFAAGVRRTFLYEFLDEGTAPTDSEQHWGLVRHDGTPKPAFRAIANLLQAMRAPSGGSVAGAAPVIDLGEPAPDVRCMVFGKPDGSAIAALWRAARVWDPGRSADIAVSPVLQRVRVDPVPRWRRTLDLADQSPAWQDSRPSGTLDLMVGPAVTLLAFA